MLNDLIIVEWLRENEHGLDVCVNDNGRIHLIDNVHPNIVYLALGAERVSLLLETGNKASFYRSWLKRSEVLNLMKNVVQ